MSFRLNLSDAATFTAARHAASTVRASSFGSKVVPAGASRFGNVPAKGEAAARIAAVLGARH